MTNLLPIPHPASWTPSLFGRTVARKAPTGRFAAVLLGWQARADLRHHLAEMDDRLLADVGLERGMVAAEVKKSFWQA